MATPSKGRAPYESGGDIEKSRKRPFRPELNEVPQKASHEGGRNNSTGVLDHQGGNCASISIIVGISELEQMLKQMTFTGSEIQRLTTLLNSRNRDNVVVERDVTSLPITPMASPQQPTTIESLPGDLLQKVFIRLLAKQLAQMRSVSKSWNALLSHSSFIKSHLHHSINFNDQILVVFYNTNIEVTHKPFTVYLSQSHLLELPNFIHFPRVSPGSGHTHRMNRVIGSVHGLICSCYGDDLIHIWNPSLSAVSTLPPYSLPCCSYEIFFRFGFDPKTEDYKVVKITGLTGPLHEEPTSSEEEGVPSFLYVIRKWLQVEIYSMRKGYWKLITHRFPSHITRIFNKDEVCVDGHDGHLHWVGHTNEKLDSEVIVAFDLCSETFLEITLPACILDYDRSNTLGVLGGKLCVTSRNGEGRIDVWVMEEYGVAESWVKRHVFSLPHCLGDAFNGFTSHNQFLLEDVDNRLVLYDPIADKVKVLEEFNNEYCNTERVVEYVDSLVWVAPPMR